MRLHTLLYFSGFIANTCAVVAPCYAPDGSPSPGTGYLPCVATSNVDSMCCVLNSTALLLAGEAIADADTCLPNGLCMERNGIARRAFCTDKTWRSPSCLNICAGGAAGGSASIDMTMTHCSDGTWCCGANNITSCCSLSLGLRLVPSLPPYAASVTPASTATTMSTALTTVATATTTEIGTPIATVTVGPTPITSPSTTNNNLGIGLGVALGVVLIAASIMGILFYRRLRLRHQEKGQKAANDAGFSYYAPKAEPGTVDGFHEVTSSREPAELFGERRTR